MSEYKYQHGLCIMRAQPFHLGHARIIDQMLSECAKVTIILGSIQEQGTARNPLNYTTRKKMLQNHYRQTADYDRLKIIGLADINNSAEWGPYVLDFLVEAFPQLPLPDAYYAGSNYDAQWFVNCIPNIVLIDRVDLSRPFVSASMVRDMLRYGDPRWKDFIHPENHALVEEHFCRPKSII